VQPLLQELGVWPMFQALAPLPSYGTRSAWGDVEPQIHTHLMTPYLQGWHIDRLRFDRMLADGAVQAGAQLLTQTRVVKAERSADGFTIKISNAGATNTIATAFLVDATGRPASIARHLGAQPVHFDKLVGVAVQMNDPTATENCYTLVESTPDGWWYTAPVAPGRSVAMLMTDADLLSDQKSRSGSGWQRALQRSSVTEARIASCASRSVPQTYSAISHRILRAPRDRSHWLAVGDAALAVDPISGSGVVRALRTAHDAADTVLAVMSGDRQAIAQYESARNAECTTYLEERSAYYALEKRWATAPFWERRLRSVRASELQQ
jgi:flavin-dependent dehydrogenase